MRLIFRLESPEANLPARLDIVKPSTNKGIMLKTCSEGSKTGGGPQHYMTVAPIPSSQQYVLLLSSYGGFNES